MRASLLIPALATLLGAGAAAVFLRGGEEPSPPPPRPNVLAHAPPPSAFAWRLTAAASADRAMVLEVETTRPAEAVAIAQQLTEPYKDRFDEVLVFVFEPDVKPRLATVRVQWTRRRGYRTLMLREVQPATYPDSQRP